MKEFVQGAKILVEKWTLSRVIPNMTTTTRSVLFVKDGENVTTPASPRAPWMGQVDLNTMESYCVAYDNDMLVSAPKYEVHEIALPEWLSTEEYCNNPTTWKWLWGCGVDAEWSETWQRSLKEMGTAYKLACVKLLKVKKFRSEFRKSLRDQLVAWLESTERKHPTPFSERQWDALIDIHVQREARSLDGYLYNNKGYNGVPKAA